MQKKWFFYLFRRSKLETKSLYDENFHRSLIFQNYIIEFWILPHQNFIFCWNLRILPCEFWLCGIRSMHLLNSQNFFCKPLLQPSPYTLYLLKNKLRLKMGKMEGCFWKKKLKFINSNLNKNWIWQSYELGLYEMCVYV